MSNSNQYVPPPGMLNNVLHNSMKITNTASPNNRVERELKKLQMLKIQNQRNKDGM